MKIWNLLMHHSMKVMRYRLVDFAKETSEKIENVPVLQILSLPQPIRPEGTNQII